MREIENRQENLLSSALVDYGSAFNQIVFDAIPAKTTCLDVGCATGNLGHALIKLKQCSMDGVESNTKAAAIARSQGYQNVFDLNLNFELPPTATTGRTYDVIVCADVLEHLIDPKQTLLQLKKLLKPGGSIIISLPNVAFVLNRLNLLLGRWDYQEYGILDRTHLRFYTISSGAAMIASSGLKCVKIKPYNQFGALRYIKPLDSWFPTLLAYQFLVIAKNEEN